MISFIKKRSCQYASRYTFIFEGSKTVFLDHFKDQERVTIESFTVRQASRLRAPQKLFPSHARRRIATYLILQAAMAVIRYLKRKIRFG